VDDGALIPPAKTAKPPARPSPRAIDSEERSKDNVLKTKEESKFDGILRFDRISRHGNHSVLAFFRITAAVRTNVTSVGKEVHVFLTDLADMIPTMKNGSITGTFTPTKRGTDYAWKLDIKKDKE
jgi:hypothetical protein